MKMGRDGKGEIRRGNGKGKERRCVKKKWGRKGEKEGGRGGEEDGKE